MAIEIYDFEQRTTEWFIACLGNPGGSGISKILTSKGELSAQRELYLNQLAYDRFTGKPTHSEFVSGHMTHGTENEDSARALFEMITGLDVKIPGVVFKDERRLCHYSPDGLIGDHEILEIKNPMAKTHVKYLEQQKIPTQYILQCQMGLYVCERDKVYFMSNCDGFAPLIIEQGRDEDMIKKIHIAIEDFGEDLLARAEYFKETQGLPF